MTKTHRFLALALHLLGAALFYGLFIARSSFRVDGLLHFTLIDDAMISMRYAQHLAAGSGLVWNVGEPAVQGFTNLGWMLFMTGLHLLPFTPADISLAVMVASAGVLLLNAVIVNRICRILNPEARYAPLMSTAIAAFYFPLVFWSLRGMEVGLLVLLVDLACLYAMQLRRGRPGAPAVLGLILAAALIVRLDSALQVILILVYAAGTRMLTPRQLLLLLLIVGVTVVGILAFQQIYFGDVLPNTYYQKIAGASIIERLRAGVLAFYHFGARDVLMMTLLATAGICFYRPLRSRETALLAGLFLVQCVYSVWIGGDYAEPEVASANRFITQGMPALIMLFSLSADRALSDIRAANSSAGRDRSLEASLLSMTAAIATLLIISGTPWFNWTIDNAPLLKADIRRVKAGLAIASNTSPSATIAVHAAGQIPYYSGRRVIDLLGLSDPVIAKGPRSASFYPGHDKWNYDYSIGQLQPDLIADNWIRLGNYIRGRQDYRQLPNGMYIRVGTTLVNEAGLLQAYP